MAAHVPIPLLFSRSIGDMSASYHPYAGRLSKDSRAETQQEIFHRQIAEDRNEFEHAIQREDLELRRELGFHIGYSGAKGSYYGSPMHANLLKGASVLDIGCGFASWCRSMARAYPRSSFVACDEIRRFDEDEGLPSNVSFCHANVIYGLPYVAESFDFIFLRAVLCGIPKSEWSTVRAEVMRLLKPGGWLEVVDANGIMDPAGPATRALGIYVETVFQRSNLPLPIVENAPDFFFEEKQLFDVNCNRDAIPAGKWAGWQGRAMLENDALVVEILEPAITAALNLSVEEYRQLAAASIRQHEEYKTCAVSIQLYAQKKFS